MDSEMDFAVVFSMNGSLVTYQVVLVEAHCFSATLEGAEKNKGLPSSIEIFYRNGSWHSVQDVSQVRESIVHAIEQHNQP